MTLVTPSRDLSLNAREILKRNTRHKCHLSCHTALSDQGKEMAANSHDGGRNMSASTSPSPEIDAVIFDMIAAEAAQVPYDGSLDDLWSSVAYDPEGEFQGFGYGHTPNEARAGAWITVWWPDCDLRAVPRVVGHS